MSPEEIKQFIQLGEGQKVEFKASFGKESIETVVAFANDEGGIILIGIDDDQTVLGVSQSSEIGQQWLNSIKQATSPSVFPDIEFVAFKGTVDRIEFIVDTYRKVSYFASRSSFLAADKTQMYAD
ncbi:helix-turn-helix domain-containing protein, partial [Planctomycetota bacterium]